MDTFKIIKKKDGKVIREVLGDKTESRKPVTEFFLKYVASILEKLEEPSEYVLNDSDDEPIASIKFFSKRRRNIEKKCKM